MRDVKTIILEPDEYKTQFDLRLLPSGQTIPQKAIIITKDGANTVVPTIFSYMVMLVSIGSLIIYIVRLIQGEGALF